MKKQKLIYIFLAVLMCVALFAACGNDKEDEATEPEPIQTTETGAEATPLPTPIPTPIPTPVPDEALTPLTDETVEETPEATETDGEDSSDSSKSSDSSSSGVLKLEMENDSVEEVQQLLKDLGYLDKVTGYFGTDTESAVKEFQENNGLTADGIVGSGTLAKLKSDDAKKAS